jgi:hypothetical protein
MLRFVDHEFGSQMQGDMSLSSATKVNDGHWVAHSENYLIDFKYKAGLLSMCMGDTYYELEYGERKIIASNKTGYGKVAGLIIRKESLGDLLSKNFIPKYILFSDILTLLNWECEDYID